MTLTNAERQARFRRRRARDLTLMKQQIHELERWVNELQAKAGLPVQELPKEAAVEPE